FYVYLLLPAVTMIHVLFELDYTNALYVYSLFFFVSIVYSASLVYSFFLFRGCSIVNAFYEKQDDVTKNPLFFDKTKDGRFFCM
ncbi:hypothetical protein V7151_23745, partial [Priestia megaterium]|uniref:hypothetical protein n=1 Tax=Priestia megaterium TaxID=1404 RepID=UPI0030007750